MANNEKLLRGNVTILLAYPEAFADPEHPTAAELNDLFAYTSNEDGKVFDVSCATLDDYTMNMADPDTDDTMTVCDVGNVSTPTFDNYEVSLDFLRDASVTANGVFNLARYVTQGPDRILWAIKRIGVPQGTPAAAGQTISMYGVSTDLPLTIVEDNGWLRHGARFKPTGDLNINYVIAA